MKIRILFILTLFAIALNSQAQDYKAAVGLRLGVPLSVSYKMFMNEQGALEFVLGYRNTVGWNYLNVGGYYEHHLPFPNVEGLKWYFGGGANIFIWSYDEAVYPNNKFGSTNLGISGCIGLDYKFADTPLNLSVDWIPTVYISSDIYSGLEAGQGALAVRYVLK